MNVIIDDPKTAAYETRHLTTRWQRQRNPVETADSTETGRRPENERLIVPSADKSDAPDSALHPIGQPAVGMVPEQYRFHSRFQVMMARFASLLQQNAAEKAVEHANAVLDFVDDVEDFMTSAVKSENGDGYFDFATLLQAAAVQLRSKSTDWFEAGRMELIDAVTRLARLNPIRHDDARTFLRALADSDLYPFEPSPSPGAEPN